MEKKSKKEDISSWAVGGGLMMGIGAGFFFLRVNPLAFVGCVMLGLGLGLIIAPIISKCKD
jgi:hypothetical protein